MSLITEPALKKQCFEQSSSESEEDGEDASEDESHEEEEEERKPIVHEKLLPFTTVRQKATQKKPMGVKTQKAHQYRNIHAQYNPLLPLLTLRPMLKNTQDTFSSILRILHACLWHVAQWNPETHLQVLLEKDFTKTFVPAQLLWSNICSPGTSKQAFMCLTAPDSRNKQNEIILYYVYKTNTLHAIDFGGIRDFSLEKIKVLVPAEHVAKIQINVISMPLARIKPGADFPFTADLFACQKLWNAVLFCICVKTPLILLDILNDLKQSASESGMLLQMFTLSMLYYLHDKQCEIMPIILRAYNAYKVRTQELLAAIQLECNLKPIVALHKKNTDGRIGKFKGRQCERLFAIVVNGCVGIHVSYEQLFHKNLFELLIYASGVTNESNFDYNDLQTMLPLVFPKNKTHCFATQFKIKTPFMITCDPVFCFGPIRNLLWPDGTTDAKLVACNNKTWKMEFSIQMVEEKTPLLTAFITSLQLSPENILSIKWNEWVSIVTEGKEEAYGIYFHDPSYSLEQAAQHLNMHKGFEVTQYQNPQRICKGTTMLTSCLDLYKLKFVKDAYHGILKGSRTQGIAVRRKYKNGTCVIRTFATAEEFVKLGECENHGYVILKNFDPDAEPRFAGPSFIMSTHHQIAELFQDTYGSTTLLCVEDIGTPKLMVWGYEPLLNFLECRECIACADDLQWVSRARGTYPIRPFNAADAAQNADFRVAFGTSSQDVTIHLPANAPIFPIIQQAAQNAHYSRYNLCSVSSKHIVYLPSFQHMYVKAIELSTRQMDQLQVTQYNQKAAYVFEAHVPGNCECCRTKTICVQALASVIAWINTLCGGSIKQIQTNVFAIQGKLVKAEPIVEAAKYGLRCKHNWTNGIPVLLAFEATFQECEKPDLFVCENNAQGSQALAQGVRVLRLL